MIQMNHSKYKYLYHNTASGHHHDYLINPLLSLLSKITKSTTNSHQIRILDLGCGNGSLTSFIAQQGYQVVGLESSESGIKFARSQHTNCEFILGSVYDAVPQNLENSFDIVLSTEVIEHLYYPRELAKYANKCLKPNGSFIITTPYHGYWKNLLLSITGKMEAHFTVLWDGGHIKFFSVNTLTRLLKLEGFDNLEFSFAGRFPFLWKSMLCSCSLSESIKST